MKVPVLLFRLSKRCAGARMCAVVGVGVEGMGRVRQYRSCALRGLPFFFIIPRPHAFDLPSFASMGIVLRGWPSCGHAMLKP